MSKKSTIQSRMTARRKARQIEMKRQGMKQILKLCRSSYSRNFINESEIFLMLGSLKTK